MRRGIQAASTPIGNTVIFQPGIQPVHRHTLRQKLLFGETLTSAATENGTNLNEAVGSDGLTNELGEPNAQQRTVNNDQAIRVPESAEKVKLNVIYDKDEFLAIRNTDDGFFICTTTRKICRPEGLIRIHWLSQSETDEQVYKLSYHQQVDFRCVLTNVRLTKMSANRYHLPKQEQTRIQGILRESIEAEKQTTLVTSPRASPVHLPPDRTTEAVPTVVSNDRMTEHRESRIDGLNDLTTQGNEGPVNDPTIVVNKEKPLTPSVSSDTSSADVEHDSALERLRQASRGSIKEKAKIKFTVDMEEQEDEG